jgi:hypothetical protein
MMLLQQLHRLADDIAAATGAGRRSARLDAHDAVEALEHIVFRAKLFRVEVHSFQHVDHRRHQLLGECERTVMFGIAADLQHAVAKQGKGRGQVGRGGRFADAALAVDGKHLGTADLDLRVEQDLDAAVAIGRA